MSKGSKQSTNIDKILTFIERWDKIAGLAASVAAALAFAADNVWLSYAFIIIGWILIARWLWRIVSLKTRTPKQSVSIPVHTELPERFFYSKSQRLLAAVGLVSLTSFVSFWFWFNMSINLKSFLGVATPTPQALLFEGALNDLLVARRAEAGVRRILPSQVCRLSSQQMGTRVYDCLTKQPLGYLLTSVAPTEWNPRYLLNREGERVGFINEIFIYDLSGYPVAIVDRGDVPRPNLLWYFDDDTLSTVMKLPITTLPLIERQGFHYDTLPNATIFSDEVESGLSIAYVIEGHFTWGEVQLLEP